MTMKLASLVAAGCVALWPACALAQTGWSGPNPQSPQALIVSSCGTQAWTLNGWAPLTQLQNGELCTSAAGGGGGGTVNQGTQGSSSSPWWIDTAPSGSNLLSAINSPLRAQASHGVNIGGTEGLAAAGAAAVGNPVQIGGKDGSGNVQAVPVTAAGTAAANAIAIQGVALGQAVPVSGYDSGPITASATPANASHTAGQSVGGLFSVGVARITGGSGIITSILFKDTNGVAESYVLRVWSKNPTNTTCADNTNFAGSATDDQYLIGGGPVSIATAVPASTQGDSAVYAALTGLTWDYKNADGTATQNVYVCLVTTATYTPAASKLVYVTVSGPQN